MKWTGTVHCANESYVSLADIVDKATRSRMMAGIRGKDTRPEMTIRRMLHALGFRYRLHDRKLPGKPDMVFPGCRAVILVHGCFWHCHDCHLFKWPASRADFWRQKITRNRKKDAETMNALRVEGWRVLTIWECALKGRTKRPIEEVVKKTACWLRSANDCEEIRGREDDVE